MKIKLIDLLNKIAEGENNIIFWYGGDYYKTEIVFGQQVIRSKKGNSYMQLEDNYNLYEILNDEVEIVEAPKKIEKLPHYDYSDLIGKLKNQEYNLKKFDKIDMRLNDYHNKIDEVIDKINEMSDK